MIRNVLPRLAGGALLALALCFPLAAQQNTQGQGTDGPPGGAAEVQSVVPEVGDGRGGVGGPSAADRLALAIAASAFLWLFAFWAMDWI